VIFKFANKILNQINYVDMDAKDFVSTKDLLIVCYLFTFHKIKEFSKKIQYQFMDFLPSMHDP